MAQHWPRPPVEGYVVEDLMALDVGVVRASACTGPDQWSYPVADTVLVVEVVAPDSEARDIDTKPHKYAAAGIPSFWRVERST
ncbi:Uma2 family endonuclease [Streptomyces sp. NPDC057686]|uniref:Uma2 family endonuclease n=1 Tax=Streptomyces sp. NPDC057686 TaxID=3346212 RepID=UPI0036A6FD6A